MTPERFIPDYFGAEKNEALLFIGVGIVAIVLSLLLVRRRSALRGMAGPLVAIALIQLVVGGTVYLRSDEQMAMLLQQQQSQPESFKAAETQRMKAVIANFVLYRNIEIGLLALGMAIVVALRRRASTGSRSASVWCCSRRSCCCSTISPSSARTTTSGPCSAAERHACSSRRSIGPPGALRR